MAKFVYESLSDIFKPKPMDQIIDSLKNLKLSSYRLSSFFKLDIRFNDINNLEAICRELNVLPEEMEISNFSGNEFLKKLFYKPFKKFDEKYDLSDIGIVEESNRYYNYSIKFKIIRFGTIITKNYLTPTTYDYSIPDYYVFPRNKIHNLFLTLLNL